MPETLNLNYYYGNEADQYSFYRIPKILLTDRRYKGVSLEAKVLYGLLLDRMGLSARNGWLDDNGRVFLYFTQEEVMTMLDCGKDKATKLFRELEGIGLVERKKQGQGHPARIYVKNFILEPEHSAPVQTAENQPSRPLDSAAVKTAEKPQSAPLKTSGQECGISAPNNTDINKTEKSDTDLSITPPCPLSGFMHISIVLVFWSLVALVRNSMVLAVYLLFSVACFFTVHERSHKISRCFE